MERNCSSVVAAEVSGKKASRDGQSLEGILWVLKTGLRWCGLRREYGSKSRCHRRLKEWQKQGVWAKSDQTLLAKLNRTGKLQWEWAFLDGSLLSAKKDEKVGLTRRGKGSKVMMAMEGQ